METLAADLRFHAEIQIPAGGCMRWPNLPSKKVAIPAIFAASALYSFAPLCCLDEPILGWFEVVMLAATVITGAVAGAAFTVHPPSKIRSTYETRVADCFLVVVMLIASWAYIQLPHVGAGEFGIKEATYETVALAILIWTGAMLAAKLSIRYGMHSLRDAAKASADTSSTKRGTPSSLEKWLHSAALITLVGIVAVAIVATYAPTTPSEHLVESGTLFTASATITGFVVFGSALTMLGQNRGLSRGIAYTLLPVIAIQATFMISLVSNIYFPATVWIVMTTAWLCIVVLVITVGKTQPGETGNGANPDCETPRSRKGREYHGKLPSCPQCGGGSVQDDDARLTSQMFPDVGGLPVNIADLYDEARASFRAQTYTGCEMLCRKILTNAAVDKGAKQDMKFVQYVDHLNSNYCVTQALKDMATTIKDNGNEAAHEINPSDRERAEYTLKFTRRMLDTMYGAEHEFGEYGGSQGRTGAGT